MFVAKGSALSEDATDQLLAGTWWWKPYLHSDWPAELLMGTLLLWNYTGWFEKKEHSVKDLPNQTTDKSILI